MIPYVLTVIFMPVFFFTLILVKPIWYEISMFVTGATGIPLPWVDIILASTVMFFLCAVALVSIKIHRHRNNRQLTIPLSLKIIPWPVLIIWAGLWAQLLSQTWALFLKPELEYLYAKSAAGICLVLATTLAAAAIWQFLEGMKKRRRGGHGRGLVYAVLLALLSVSVLLHYFLVVPAPDHRLLPGETQNPKTPAEYVNTLIGTRGGYEYGRTTPAVTPPFGMTHWSPITGDNAVGHPIYKYDDTTMHGFTGTHKPAYWMGDYGQVIIMPGTGKVSTSRSERALPCDHTRETATPWYYRVPLDSPQGTITAEMTATTRCGIMRFTFPEGSDPFLVIEASRHPGFEGSLSIDPDSGVLTGWNSDRFSDTISPSLENFRGHFVIMIDLPVKEYGTWGQDGMTSGTPHFKGNHGGMWVRLDTSRSSTVTMHTGTSFISGKQAMENLRRETSKRGFGELKKLCRWGWEEALSRVTVQSGSTTDKISFYTAMYHCLLYPRVFSEYGCYYSPFDDRVHTGTSYNDYSLWDTFRALHPLLILAAPQHVNGMMQSLVQNYREGGWMPKWPNPTYSNIMIGTHADSVIADALVKGFSGFDVQDAYRAMLKNATVPPEGDREKRWADRDPWTSYEARGGLSWYMERGYVASDKTAESVSRTLEFAYDDFCVAQAARVLGKSGDYRRFMKRSKNYRNVYNSRTGLMAPRHYDGTWDPDPRSGFTEGDPWTYLFCVMHDPDGLIELMGGTEKFTSLLDENFEGGHYVHENEPGHHYTYLYNYAGKPWKTQEMAARYRHEKYGATPDGLSGDDDCGQMSAWYVFSALGFYPVAPGSKQYALGTPLFREATLNLQSQYGQRRFIIKAEDLSGKNIYVKNVRLNGRQLEEPFISHDDIVRGGTLVFTMTSRPNHRR